MNADDPSRDRKPEPDAPATDAASRPGVAASQTWEDHGAPWWSPDPVAPSLRAVRRGRPPRSAAAASPAEPVAFTEHRGVYTGARGGRAWRITEVLTGWRLEFRDVGDGVSTFAGVHHSVAAAIAEANS